MTTTKLEDFYQLDVFSNASIRVDAATQKASAIDVTVLVTGQKPNEAAAMVRNLPDELRKKIPKLRINGKGRETWVADAPTLVEMIWELPGKAAKAFRRQSSHFICRLLGGDRTLIDEIELRYDRSSDEAKEFLLSNVERPVMPDPTEEEMQRIRKRKRDDLEILEREMSLKQAAMTLKKDEMTLKKDEIFVKEKEIELNQKVVELLGHKDAQLKAAAYDNIKNIVMGSRATETKAIEDKSNASDFLPDLSKIVKELSGKTLPTKELAQIGRKISKAYKRKYGCKPKDKTLRFCNGANVEVNAYRQKDRDLVYDVVERHIQSNSSE